MIKSISLLSRKSGMTHEEFMKHWVEIHGPLARSVPGLRRYLQSDIVEERFRQDIPALEGEVDGIAELWYDDLESLRAANNSPEAKRLHADGATFIGRIKTFTVNERVVIG